MIHFASTLLGFVFLFSSFSQAALTQEQAYFKATVRAYNKSSDVAAWLKKQKSQISEQDFRVLQQQPGPQFLKAIQTDVNSFEFRDSKGASLATMKVNSAGELLLNGHVLTLSLRRGVREQLQYLQRLLAKKTALWNVLVPEASAVYVPSLLELSILKFSRDYARGFKALYAKLKDNPDIRDADILTFMIKGQNVSRVDHQCTYVDGSLPKYMKGKYEDEQNQIMMTKVNGEEALAVRSLTFYRLDEDGSESEQTVDVVIKPRGNLMLGFNKPRLNIADFNVDIWRDGELVQQNLSAAQFVDLKKVGASSDSSLRMAGTLMACCGDTSDKSRIATTQDKSCLERAAARLQQRGAPAGAIQKAGEGLR